MPVLAGSFWAGILAWPTLRGAAPPWALVAWGIAVLAIGAVAAPRSRGSSSGAPARTPGGESAPPALAAPSAPAAGPDRLARAPPLFPAFAAAATFFLLGAGWAGLHEERVRSSPLASLGPETVTAVGSLQGDPSAGRFGWSAVFGISEVRIARSGGGDPAAGTEAIPVRGAVWLEGSGSLPV